MIANVFVLQYAHDEASGILTGKRNKLLNPGVFPKCNPLIVFPQVLVQTNE